MAYKIFVSGPLLWQHHGRACATSFRICQSGLGCHEDAIRSERHQVTIPCKQHAENDGSVGRESCKIGGSSSQRTQPNCRFATSDITCDNSVSDEEDETGRGRIIRTSFAFSYGHKIGVGEASFVMRGTLSQDQPSFFTTTLSNRSRIAPTK